MSIWFYMGYALVWAFIGYVIGRQIRQFEYMERKNKHRAVFSRFESVAERKR